MAKQRSRKTEERSPSKRPVKRNEHGQIVKGSGPLNPVGRAPDGESWAATFKHVFNQTPEEAAQYAGEIGKRLKRYGKGPITLKELIAYRLADALLFDPSAGLLTAVMDRAEGKLSQTVNVNWREEIIQLVAQGRLTREEVTEELGEDLATELFVFSGVPITAN